MLKISRLLVTTGVLAIVVLLGLGVLFASTSLSTSIYRAQDIEKARSRPSQQDVAKWLEKKARYPTVDYNSPEPSNPDEKVKRTKRNKHYDKRDFVAPTPNTSRGSATIRENEFDMPALPVVLSKVIVTADVLNSQAYLSNDKSGVYSEFTLQIETVLKGDVPTLSQTNLISVSREGGAVRYPSGHVELFIVNNQNMPAVGKKYLLFLSATEDSQAYELLTGYELCQEVVLPLDDGAQFEKFRGNTQIGFLSMVRCHSTSE